MYLARSRTRNLSEPPAEMPLLGCRPAAGKGFADADRPGGRTGAGRRGAARRALVRRFKG
jgi:hypothetical protein